MTDAPVTSAPVSSPNPTPAASPASPDTKAAPATSGTNTFSGQESPKTGTPEAKPETFEMKVNGQVRKVGREEAIRLAQLGYSATERFEQAAAKEKQVQSLLSKAKQDPIGMLMDAGLTEAEAQERFEEWYSKKFIEPEALTREQRETKALQDELKRYKAQEKEAQDRAKAEAEEQEVAAHRETIQKQIMDAMEAHKLPKSKFTVSRIAFYMKQALNKGFEAPMDLIVQQVKQEEADRRQEIPEGASYETLVDMYGQSVVDKIISEHLKHIRNKRGQASAAPVQSSGAGGASNLSGKITMREAEENLKRLMGRA